MVWKWELSKRAIKAIYGNILKNFTKFSLIVAIFVWLTFIILISNGVFQRENLKGFLNLSINSYMCYCIKTLTFQRGLLKFFN